MLERTESQDADPFRPRGRWIAAALLLLLGAILAPAAAAAPPEVPLVGSDRDISYDWIQTTSGEWLKGELEHMQDESLVFDSDEFDDQTLDWDDIASLVSKRPQTIRLIHRREPISGILEMRDGVVTITAVGETLSVQASDIMSIIPGEGRELDWWSFEASLGYTGRAGNTEQTDLTATIDLMRRTPSTRFETSYLGSFSATSGVQTANNNRVKSTGDWFVTRRLYIRAVMFEFYNDQFQNLDRRLTIGSGLGYEVLSNRWVTWEVSAALGLQNSKYTAGSPVTTNPNDVVVIPVTTIELDLWKGIEWDNTYQINIVPTDMDKTSQHAASVLSFDIWGPLDVDVSFIFDRIEGPQPSLEGGVLVTPLQNDYKTVVGLAFDT